jgi:hypothetical protein
MTIHLRCGKCKLVDMVSKEKALNWVCPNCNIPEMPAPKIDHSNEIYRLEQIIRSVERLNHNCEDNMKRLNNMMLELKGIIAIVRPAAKKNDWYKTEINADFKNTVESALYNEYKESESELKNKGVMSIELKD